MARAAGEVQFDSQIISNVHILKDAVEQRVGFLLSTHVVKQPVNMAAWLLKAISVIDLTTLSGDDTRANVERLCIKATQPLSRHLYKELGFKEWTDGPAPVTTAAVCVYPSRVADAKRILHDMGQDLIAIASVATGFPSGLYPLATRLQEIQYAVNMGASEIDVVIDRSLALTGQWKLMFEELVLMKEACGDAHMKVILGVGELGTYNNIYNASMVAMSAGADFIKTSTGKEAVNATLPIGLVMCRAIRIHYQWTGKKVGLKPAGGIKTPKDAVDWLILVKEELGDAWLTPALFRIGASSLLGGIEKWLHEYVTGERGDDAKFSFI